MLEDLIPLANDVDEFNVLIREEGVALKQLRDAFLSKQSEYNALRNGATAKESVQRAEIYQELIQLRNEFEERRELANAMVEEHNKLQEELKEGLRHVTRI